MTPTRRERSGSSLGPSVDQTGTPVVDPTRNVLDLVSASIARQDDLREAAILRCDMAAAHINAILKERGEHSADLRAAESKRIDAIRAVDVAAVTRAAEVATVQATTLAAQVSASAEAMRTQVAAAASAAAVALATALEPIQRSIDDLRRAQYEAQGVRAQTTESGVGSRAWVGIAVAAGVGFFGLVISAAGIAIAVLAK